LNFTKKIWLLIICSCAIRILIAGSLELGNDEVYYQTYPQFLQWNYFDHPPLIALLIRLTTFNLYFHQELFVRAGPVICSAISTWIIFKTGSLIAGARAGWYAAFFYNTSFYTSIIAGTFILPDSPQVVFWLVSLYLMIRILDTSEKLKKNQALFILLGVSIGLCIMSKVHGIFLWFGFGAYIIFHRRDLLKSPSLWIAVLITILIISPIYFWNLANHFITYRYHQGRLNFWGSKPDLDQLLQQAAGSIFYSNPVNFIFYLVSLYALLKNRKNSLPPYFPLLLWTSLPLIIVLLWTSLFSETLPHWSGPAYLSMMLISARHLDEIAFGKKMNWLKASSLMYVAVVLAGLASILFLPFTIGSKEIRYLGKGDITLDMSGWAAFSEKFDSLYRSDVSTGKIKSGATLISDYWFPAGHLDYYYAGPKHQNLLAFGNLNDIHHFAWLNARRPRLKKGGDAYFIYPSNYYGPPSLKLKNNFELTEDSVLIPQSRMGNPVRYFVVYRMHDFKGDSSSYLFPGIY
jgi:4-amino-4-deoxy-L-arabinose transferase-like glycosyltransferase